MTELTHTKPPWIYGAIALATFAAAILSRDTLLSIGWYASVRENFPELIRRLEQPALWAIICLIGLALAHRTPPWRAWRELGIAAPAGKAILATFIACTPMLILFAPTGLNPEYSIVGSLFGACIYPFAEEFLFRGYAFRQLHRYAHLNLWVAAAIVGLVFGLAHLGNASVKDLPLAGELGTVAIITLGGMLYAWLFAKWDDNLWVPFAMHAFMNLWWDLFAVSESPLGGIGANIARILTAVLIILLTIYRDRIPFLSSKSPAE